MIRLFEAGAWLVCHVPFPLRIALARLGGRLVFAVSRRVRRNTIANMAVVLGLAESDARVAALARESVVQYVEHLTDLLRFHRQTPDEVVARVRGVDAVENILAAKGAGRGVIFVSAHFGNWEVAGAYLARDNPMVVIQETFASKGANELLRRIRAAKYLRALQMEHAARPIIRVLRDNGFMAMVADRPTPDAGIAVTFFGRRTAVPQGVARFALLADAAVLVGGMIRLPDHTYQGVAMPPIFPDRSRDRDAEVARITQAVMTDIESLIRRRPDQWYMFRPMWVDASRTCRGSDRGTQ